MVIALIIVQIIAGIIEILLALRLLFIFLNSHMVGFVATIFAWTDPLVAPTTNFFPGLVPLLAVLFAMFVYAVIFGIVIAVLRLL